MLILATLQQNLTFKKNAIWVFCESTCSVYVYMFMDSCICTCVWKSEVHVRWLAQSCLHLNFEAEFVSEAETYWFSKSAWPVRSRNPPVSISLGAGIADIIHHHTWLFMWVLRIWTLVLTLMNQILYRLYHLPNPLVLYCKYLHILIQVEYSFILCKDMFLWLV